MAKATVKTNPNLLTWDVHVKVDIGGKKIEKNVTVKELNRYDAQVSALQQVIDENQIVNPKSGFLMRPYHLLNVYRNLTEINVKCTTDRRVRY